MKNIEKQYGVYKIELPENVANTIDAIQCMLYMEGYESKFKKSEKERLQKLFDDKKLGIYYQAKNISFVD